MKTRNLSLATFILGAAGVSIAACSAQADGTPPRGSAGDSSTAGASVIVSAGSAGSPAVISAGAGGSASTTAGAPGTSAGAPSGGSPGTVGTSGAAGSGPVAGGAGGAAKGTCVVAAGVASALSIDDLEDGENKIQELGSRSGYWYTYNDKTGTQTPAPDATGLVPFKPTAGGHSPLFAAHTSGTAFTTWGAGMGFDFNNTAAKSCVYNATVYSGIKFWAKGNVAIKAMVKIPGTTISTADSGTCTVAAMCEDHYFLQPKPILSDAWTQYTMDFASATTFAQEGWGTKVPFDKANIIAVQFQVGMGVAFDFSVDDITFY